jgi:predicted alpha/beta hydrolase family esterase
MSVDRPVILVGHSLGCHAIAWWATLNGQASAPSPVVGALLVAPPEVDSRFVGVPLRNFAPSPVAPFRFPTTLVASQDDPFAHPRRSRRLAERWQSRFVDVGKKGHINAVSGLGFWDEGQAILDELIERALPEPASTPPSLKRGASAS